MIGRALILTGLGLGAGPGCSWGTATGLAYPPTAQAPDDVDERLAALGLREKIGQMVMPKLEGAYLAEGTEDWRALDSMVTRLGVGGFVIDIGPPYEVAARIAEARRRAEVPLLIAADFERGAGQRLQGGVVLPYLIETGGAVEFPPGMALGATGAARYAYEVGRAAAVAGRAVGVDLVLAPVLDVNNDPANPIINVRSFGEEPAAVAEFGVAFVRGVQDAGLLATAKHFPGHGDTGVDSHVRLPVIEVSRARLDSIELVPFRAAIDAGVDAVMIGHIGVPALEGRPPPPPPPATLSRSVVTGLLREELGFDGLVLTDALDMQGLTADRSPGELAVRAVEAGADILLAPVDVAATIDAVVGAVAAGRLTEARLDDSVRRILRAKRRVATGVDEGGAAVAGAGRAGLDRLDQFVGRPEHRCLAQEIADRAVTLVRDSARLVPIESGGRRVRVVVYREPLDLMAGRELLRELRRRGLAFEGVVVDDRTAADSLARILEWATATNVSSAADSTHLIVFAPFTRARAWKGSVALPPSIAAFARELGDAGRGRLIVVAFGSPYVLSQIPDAGTYMVAWGLDPYSQRAGARALVGDIAPSGRLPIRIADHPVGHGLVPARSGDGPVPQAR